MKYPKGHKFKSNRQRKKVMALIKNRQLDPKTQKRLSTVTHSEPRAVRELLLFTENDADIYRQRLEPIRINLEKKWRKGTFDKDKAVVAYMNAVDDAARKYKRDFGGQSDIFTKADRLAVAKSLTRSFIDNTRRDYPRTILETQT